MLLKLTRSDELDGDNPVEGDLHITSHKLVYLTTLEDQVAQRIKCRLRFFRTEWFRDRLQGTPWFDGILEKGMSADRRDFLLRQVILTTPGVVGIEEFTSVLDGKTRALSVVFVARLEGGRVLNSADFGPFIVGG